MKLENIDINETIQTVKQMLEKEKGLNPGLKSSLELLLLIISLLVNRLGLNSNNSSKPPSSDLNRKKIKKSGKRKQGGQEGHNGVTLKKVASPDKTEELKIDRSLIPDVKYHELEPVTRQVIDIDISKVVTEFRAQVLEDQDGNRYVAEFPKYVTRPVQYGLNVKAHAVYMSQYQLIPYHRIEEHFQDQVKIPVSAGSIFNFNKDAYNRLKEFEQIVKSKLVGSKLIHSDETGININGESKGYWIHCASNDRWTFLYPHQQRGHIAMDEMEVLPNFKGILCHDHWKTYFRYQCSHSLCNAHHIRELERAWEQDGQKWAKSLKILLIKINQAVKDANDVLKQGDSVKYRKKYRSILKKGEKECPPPDKKDRKGQRGRVAKSKSRNLLERLIDFEEETLRFMDDPNAPFTNNQGERDIRMAKVHRKISGCFRSMEGAKIFCRIRSYLSTCHKNDMSSSEALALLFKGKLPDFLNQAFK